MFGGLMPIVINGTPKILSFSHSYYVFVLVLYLLFVCVCVGPLCVYYFYKMLFEYIFVGNTSCIARRTNSNEDNVNALLQNVYEWYLGGLEIIGILQYTVKCGKGINL